MRRYLPLLIAGAALIAAACSDTFAPKQPTTPAATIAKLGGGPRSWASIWDSTLAEENAEVVVFTINPEGGSTAIGNFRLEYDSNSVCDPETSGYGPDTWLNECQTLNTPITITGKFWMQGGDAFAEFSPNIRFSPDRGVYLRFVPPPALANVNWENEIWYTTLVDGTRYFIDETYNDPAVLTVREEDGTIRRRIRHFTQWWITGENRECDPSIETCDGGSP